jgi:hypothetical protein
MSNLSHPVGRYGGLEERSTVFVEIVFTGLPIDRDEVQEALEATLGPGGEITGAGSGMGRCHLDLEIQASPDPAWHWIGCAPCWLSSASGVRDFQRQRLIRRLDEAIPADALITADTGAFLALGSQGVKVARARCATRTTKGSADSSTGQT